jgi:hypothetical protein
MRLLTEHKNGRRAFSLAIGALGFSAFGLATADASETRTVQGGEAPLFGSSVATWAKLDAAGNVLEAGVTIPYAVIENAPDENHSEEFKADAVVEFPADVQRTTFLDHLGLFWEPHGHEPEGRYDTPHFDFHFFGIEPAGAAAIDCTNLEQRDPALAPDGWLPPVPPGADPQDFCVPLMGYHLVPMTEFRSPGEWQPCWFDKVMIAGEYAGRYSFLEPMVTKAVLEEKRSFELSVPRPVQLGRAALYPTKFEAIFDEGANAYQLVFSGFEPIE